MNVDASHTFRDFQVGFCFVWAVFLIHEASQRPERSDSGSFKSFHFKEVISPRKR